MGKVNVGIFRVLLIGLVVVPLMVAIPGQGSVPTGGVEGVKPAPQYKRIGQGNPLMTQRFSADPFAMEYDGRLYVYSTHDSVARDAAGKTLKNTYGQIKDLNCISTEDMVNWTDHGVVRVARNGKEPYASSWASNSWAPAAAHKSINGRERFFLYYANNASGIGVLASDTPVGPWVDPIGEPLVSRETPNCRDITWLFDPAVLVDDDGRAYLYFGGGVPEGRDEAPGTLRVVELGNDMISLAGTPKAIDAPWAFEDAGINRIGDTYHFTYCSNWADRKGAKGPNVPEKAEIIHMTSKNPFGPWEYKGSILRNPGTFFGCYGNNHHSMVRFKDKWYIFYHAEVMNDKMGMPGGYRSVMADEVRVQPNGTIKPVTATMKGVKQLSNPDPYKVNGAETIAWMSGLTTVECKDPGGPFPGTNMAVAGIGPGGWLGVSKVDFGTVGAKSFTAKVSGSNGPGVIGIRLGKPDGETIGCLDVPKTDDGAYVEVTTDVRAVTGIHDLFLVFVGEGFLLDSWKFGR